MFCNKTVKAEGNVIGKVEISLQIPDCGSSTTTIEDVNNRFWGDWNWDSQTNPPLMSVPEGKHYAIDGVYPGTSQASSGYNGLPAYWGNYQADEPFIGTFTAGSSYKATLFIVTEWGYSFSDNVVITVNGITMDNYKIGYNSYEGTYNLSVWPEITIDHNWDSGVITKEASDTEDGERTFTCFKCGNTRTEEIPNINDVVWKFDDINRDDWYHSAVQYAYDNGVMNGTGVSFEPNGLLKREQFVRVLYNISGQPSVEGLTNSFLDVKNKWYHDAVLWATANEVTNGIGDGKFGVGNNITREQLVTMTYRYAEKNGYNLTVTSGVTAPYSDSAKVSDWAKEAFDWAVSQGIVTGKGTGSNPADLSLDPQGTATRAECAAIMMRLLQKNGR